VTQLAPLLGVVEVREQGIRFDLVEAKRPQPRQRLRRCLRNLAHPTRGYWSFVREKGEPPGTTLEPRSGEAEGTGWSLRKGVRIVTIRGPVTIRLQALRLRPPDPVDSPPTSASKPCRVLRNECIKLIGAAWVYAVFTFTTVLTHSFRRSSA